MSRYIDADALQKDVRIRFMEDYHDGFGIVDIADIIDNQPTVDAVPVVRCKECKWYRPSLILPPNRFCYRLLDNDGNHIGYNMADEDYCSHGERRTE